MTHPPFSKLLPYHPEPSRKVYIPVFQGAGDYGLQKNGLYGFSASFIKKRLKQEKQAHPRPDFEKIIK